MVGSSEKSTWPGRRLWQPRLISSALCALAFFSAALAARAMLQFDVFLGYDGIVPEATWVPIVCEIKNDGPSFNGMVEVSGGNLEQGQTRQLVVELPTGTTKRVVIPVFSSSRYGSWNWTL